LLAGGEATVRSPKDIIPYFFAQLLVKTFAPRQMPLSRSECRSWVKEHLEPAARHCADLILAWCWAGSGPSSNRSDFSNSTAPRSFLEAVRVLRTACHNPQTPPEVLHNAAASVIQRLEQDGYAWREVPRGTPFSEDMRTEFDPVARVLPGQPVETRQPAILRNGILVDGCKGLLQRLPDADP
jgi:hypothetical protein